jgi:hypothetical protein
MTVEVDGRVRIVHPVGGREQVELRAVRISRQNCWCCGSQDGNHAKVPAESREGGRSERAGEKTTAVNIHDLSSLKGALAGSIA